MTTQRQTERIVLHELQTRPGTTADLMQRFARSEEEVLSRLRSLNSRIRAVLGYEDDPVVARPDGGWRAEGVAGLLRLDEEIEIEVVPKFLAVDSPTWRSDFFLIAVLASSGNVLSGEEISASPDRDEDLATLVARALIQMHEQSHRGQIRRYSRRERYDYAADGDVDWETVALPEADGFRLERIELGPRSVFNATLKQALRILRDQLADSDTESLVDQCMRRLGPQDAAPTDFPPLPPRFSAWAACYELSKHVVQGYGLNLRGGQLTGPGFIVSTWSVWQSLCEVLLHQALPSRRIVGQHRWPLGRRGDQIVYARPDISVFYGSGAEYLLDAKYKTRVGRRQSINSADLYESLAFMRAANTRYISLLYPSTRSVLDFPLGTCSIFDSVTVDNSHVDGLEVQIQGLSRRGGVNAVVRGVRQALRERALAIATTME